MLQWTGSSRRLSSHFALSLLRACHSRAQHGHYSPSLIQITPPTDPQPLLRGPESSSTW
ncbi:uncharacterized, partial [Tachysurus ichikawai]